MLIEILRKELTNAIKNNLPEKEILRFTIGELQLAESRISKLFSDEDAFKVLRKIIQSNTETLSLVISTESEVKNKLQFEINFLSKFLPQTLSLVEIERILIGLSAEIQDAKSDGQAIGIAMKALKTSGKEINGTDVQTIVKKIRFPMPKE